MKFLFQSLSVIGIVLLSLSHSFAQDSSTDNSPDSDAVEETTEIDQQAQLEQAASDAEVIVADVAEEEESSARFIPTEEISQDLGVSFPVDI